MQLEFLAQGLGQVLQVTFISPRPHHLAQFPLRLLHGPLESLQPIEPVGGEADDFGARIAAHGTRAYGTLSAHAPLKAILDRAFN